jgi:hypothetical protein
VSVETRSAPFVLCFCFVEKWGDDAVSTLVEEARRRPMVVLEGLTIDRNRQHVHSRTTAASFIEL